MSCVITMIVITGMNPRASPEANFHKRSAGYLHSDFIRVGIVRLINLKKEVH